MGSIKDVAATKHSSLNPNAAVFVPSALRAASANTNNFVVRNELSGISGAAFTHRNESSNSSTSRDQNLQDYRILLPDDITPDFRSFDDHMSIAEDGRALIDEHLLTCIDIRDPMEVLVAEFPGYSVECLKQAYNGNGNDLISTIAMLKDLEDENDNDLISTIARLNGLELQDDDNPLWESNIESAFGTNIYPNAGIGRSAQVSPNTFTPDSRVCNGNWLQEYAILQQPRQFHSRISLDTGETRVTGFSSDLVVSAEDHAHAQNTSLAQAWFLLLVICRCFKPLTKVESNGLHHPFEGNSLGFYCRLFSLDSRPISHQKSIFQRSPFLLPSCSRKSINQEIKGFSSRTFWVNQYLGTLLV